MYHIQTSLFYDLQELVRNSSLLRKYYYLFKALDLSILPDRNHGVGRTRPLSLASSIAAAIGATVCVGVTKLILEQPNSCSSSIAAANCEMVVWRPWR